MPDDLDPAEALRLVPPGTAEGRRTATCGCWRCTRSGLIVSLPFVVVPGPNVFGYFFTFTVVGHFLAFRGARRGLNGRAVVGHAEPAAHHDRPGRGRPRRPSATG